MAVDSRAKRIQILNLGQPGASRMLPWPDGSITEADRRTFLGLFSSEFGPLTGVEYAFTVGALFVSFIVGAVVSLFIVPDETNEFEDN